MGILLPGCILQLYLLFVRYVLQKGNMIYIQHYQLDNTIWISHKITQYILLWTKIDAHKHYFMDGRKNSPGGIDCFPWSLHFRRYEEYRWDGQTSLRTFVFCLNCKPDVNVRRRLFSFMWHLIFRNVLQYQKFLKLFYFPDKRFDLITNITLQKVWKIVTFISSTFYSIFGHSQI